MAAVKSPGSKFTALIGTFRDLGAFRSAPPGQPFTLASGKTSPYYVDCRKVLLHPRGNRFAVNAMVYRITEYLTNHGIFGGKLCIGATGVGGAPLLGGLMYSMGATDNACGFIIRDTPKDHGLQRLVEGTVDPTAILIMVDDVLTTGGTILKSVDNLQERMGVKPRLLVTLVDREEGGADMLKSNLGIDIVSVLTMQDLAFI